MVSHQVKTGTRTDPWYLDSAATSHITNCRDVFTSMRQIRDTVAVADGRQLASLGQGTIRIRFGESGYRYTRSCTSQASKGTCYLLDN